VIERVRALLRPGGLGVLATASANGRPHASLMAFAAGPVPDSLIVATREGTVKHRNMAENPRVSFLVDRQVGGGSRELGQVEALTLSGMVRFPGRDEAGLSAKQQLRARHPDLAGFLDDPEVAPVVIAVDSYLLAEGPGRVHFISVSEGT
jgi:hypothetical protein